MENDSTRFMSVDLTSKLSDEQVKYLLEILSAFEHEQWAKWTKYFLDNLTPENIARWRRQIATPYAELSEKEKDSDRFWARVIMKVLKEGRYPE